MVEETRKSFGAYERDDIKLREVCAHYTCFNGKFFLSNIDDKPYNCSCLIIYIYIYVEVTDNYFTMCDQILSSDIQVFLFLKILFFH